ncbi:hypothetical protein SGLAM104S_08442 [Streptomyces glaucescens]
MDFRNGDVENAVNMAKVASWPQAEWFTEGTPGEVRSKVSRLVHRARAVGRTPVLVAYNVPGRDCTQYSSGGAASSAAYRQWIDAFAAGLSATARRWSSSNPTARPSSPRTAGPPWTRPANSRPPGSPTSHTPSGP